MFTSVSLKLEPVAKVSQTLAFYYIFPCIFPLPRGWPLFSLHSRVLQSNYKIILKFRDVALDP